MRLGAPKMGLNVLYGYRPDAPVFFNLFPGIWTGAHPPPENTILHAFQRSRIFLFLKELTYDAKVREKDFACFASFASR